MDAEGVGLRVGFRGRFGRADLWGIGRILEVKRGVWRVRKTGGWRDMHIVVLLCRCELMARFRCV